MSETGEAEPTRSLGTETITVGPLWLFFSNKNADMGLRGHSHSARCSVTFRTIGDIGFPAFEDTVRALQDALRVPIEQPVAGTNEKVARLLMDAAIRFSYDLPPCFDRFIGTAHFRVVALQLDVLGVHDAIGHAEGFTTYRIDRR